MSTTKQKIINAVPFMCDSDAEYLWATILHMHSKQDGNIIHISATEVFNNKSYIKDNRTHTSKEVISLTDYITR